MAIAIVECLCSNSLAHKRKCAVFSSESWLLFSDFFLHISSTLVRWQKINYFIQLQHTLSQAVKSWAWDAFHPMSESSAFWLRNLASKALKTIVRFAKKWKEKKKDICVTRTFCFIAVSFLISDIMHALPESKQTLRIRKDCSWIWLLLAVISNLYTQSLPLDNHRH